MNYSEIKYQPEKAKTYLGSPSIVRLPDGSLIATHDYFGPGCPRNHEGEEALVSVYRSEDNGQTWINITHIMNCYWSSLFYYRDALYIIGPSQGYGSFVIRKSTDGGFTWTQPRDQHSGLLLKGGYYHENPNYHTSVVPMLFHNGRIYRGVENCIDTKWGLGFETFVISIDENDDLLEASNWRISNKIQYNPDFLPWKNEETGGWLEGNVCAAPDGQIWNILRVQCYPHTDVAAMVKVSADGSTISFDPAADLINFPGGRTKFVIRRDPVTGLYLSLVNAPLKFDPAHAGHRNFLSLSQSKDLRNWTVVKELLHDESGLEPQFSALLTGFQYADWQFDGDDIIYVVRMAWRGAHNYHDSNRITFHTLRNFRSLLLN